MSIAANTYKVSPNLSPSRVRALTDKAPTPGFVPVFDPLTAYPVQTVTGPGYAFHVDKNPVAPTVTVELEAGQTIRVQPGTFLQHPAGTADPLTLRADWNWRRGLLTGEPFNQTFYKAENGPGKVQLQGPMLQSIHAIDMANHPEGILVQPGAFFAGPGDSTIKVSTGLKNESIKPWERFWSGEGIFLSEITSRQQGHVLVNAIGQIRQEVLQPGEKRVLKSGLLVGLEPHAQLSLQGIEGNLWQKLLKAEGLVQTVVEAVDKPVTMWVQSHAALPFKRQSIGSWLGMLLNLVF